MPFGLGFFATAGAGGGGVATSYDLIETAILNGSQASVTFSNLNTYSSTYKHLQIRATVKQSIYNYGDLAIYFNSFTGNFDYFFHQLTGNGSSVFSTGASSTEQQILLASALNRYDNGSSSFAASVIDIPDAYDSNKPRVLRAFSGSPSIAGVSLVSGFRRSNSAAISSITLRSTSDATFTTGTRFSIYGIKGA